MLDRLKKSVCLTLAGAILAMQVVMPVGGWGNAYFARDVRTSNYSSCLFYCSDSYFDFDSSSFLLHQAEALSIEFDAPDSFNSLEDLGYYYILVILLNLAANFIDIDDDFLDALNTQITNTAKKVTVYDYTEYFEDLVTYTSTIKTKVSNMYTYVYGIRNLLSSHLSSIDEILENFYYAWNSSSYILTDFFDGKYNSSSDSYDYITVWDFYDLLESIVDYLSDISEYESTISSRLYYSSGSVAYWCYQIYTSLHSGSNTAYTRLNNIYTLLSNMYSYMQTSSSLDYSDVLEDIYEMLVLESDDIDSIGYSLSTYMWSDSYSSVYVYPTSIESTSSGSTVTIYYSSSSSRSSGTWYADMRFYSSSTSYVARDLNPDYNESGSVTYSLSFIPESATLNVYDDYGSLSSSGYVSWFSTYVNYVDTTVANLLYEILAALSGVSTGNTILSVTVDTDALEDLLSYDGYSAAYLLYQIYSSLGDLEPEEYDYSYLEYQSGSVAYWVYQIYQAQDVDSNSDLLSTLSSFASLLLDSTEFAALLSELATVDVSDTVPVVVLSAAVTFSASLAAVDAVAPALDVYIPLGDGSAYTSSFDLYDLSSYLEIWKAVVLVLYALGLVQAFRSYVLKPGGDE